MPRSDPRNSSRYWRSRELPGFGFLTADFTAHDYPPHTHDDLVVAVTEEGWSSFKSRGVVEHARRSSILVFNPGEPHSTAMRDSGRWRYRAIYLTADASRSVCNGLGTEGMPHFTRNLFDDPALVEALTKLHRRFEKDAEQDGRQDLLFTTFGTLIARYGDLPGKPCDAPRDRQVVRSVMDFMADNHRDVLCLADFSQLCGRSPFQLIRCFNKTLGMSPHACLTQIRLDRACRLLQRGDRTADVAVSVGFYDQSALNKYFKRAYGITPLQYSSAFQN